MSFKAYLLQLFDIIEIVYILTQIDNFISSRGGPIQ